MPRLVAHIDADAVTALGAYYARSLAAGARTPPPALCGGGQPRLSPFFALGDMAHGIYAGALWNAWKG